MNRYQCSDNSNSNSNKILPIPSCNCERCCSCRPWTPVPKCGCQIDGDQKQDLIQAQAQDQEQEQDLIQAQAQDQDQEQDLIQAQAQDQDQEQDLIQAQAQDQDQEQDLIQAQAQDQDQEQDLIQAQAQDQDLAQAQAQDQDLGQAQAQEQDLGQAQAQDQDLAQAQAQDQDLGQAQAQDQDLGQAQAQNQNLGQAQASGDQTQDQDQNLGQAQAQDQDLCQAQAEDQDQAQGQLQALGDQNLTNAPSISAPVCVGGGSVNLAVGCCDDKKRYADSCKKTIARLLNTIKSLQNTINNSALSRIRFYAFGFVGSPAIANLVDVCDDCFFTVLPVAGTENVSVAMGSLDAIVIRDRPTTQDLFSLLISYLDSLSTSYCCKDGHDCDDCLSYISRQLYAYKIAEIRVSINLLNDNLTGYVYSICDGIVYLVNDLLEPSEISAIPLCKIIGYGLA